MPSVVAPMAPAGNPPWAGRRHGCRAITGVRRLIVAATVLRRSLPRLVADLRCAGSCSVGQDGRCARDRRPRPSSTRSSAPSASAATPSSVPTVRSQSLVYDELGSADELPAGWVDVQEGGSFRLQRGDDEALFAHTVGHDSLKRFLFPPQLAIWRARRGADGTLEVDEPEAAATLRVRRRALVRPARGGDPGPRLHGRPVRRRRLRGPPAGRLLRGGQLRARRRDVLLRVDGHRPAGHRPASTWR